jgi:hypothetical protein
MDSRVDAFKTPGGTRVVAITTQQMREVDRIAMDETGPNLILDAVIGYSLVGAPRGDTRSKDNESTIAEPAITTLLTGQAAKVHLDLQHRTIHVELSQALAKAFG